MNGFQIEFSSNAANPHAHLSRTAAPTPDDLGNKVLRQAVQENLVSFPSQVPAFGKQFRAAFQQNIVLLYFVRGWTTDQIANRYGLGQQPIVQILTAWRIRATKEGYIQPIESAQPLFLQVRLEESTHVSEMPMRAPVVAKAVKMTSAPIPIALQVDDHPSPITRSTELKGLTLVEKLHAIVGVLDNQLRLCSEPLRGNLDSCEQLLARARALCASLEDQIEAPQYNVAPQYDEAPNYNDGGRTTTVISAAKELFRRFQAQEAERSYPPSKPVLADGVNGKQMVPGGP
jgi:transposase-like protein